MSHEPYRSPPGRHRHLCGRCGVVWEHADEVTRSEDDVLEAAHACPECKREEYFHYGSAGYANEDRPPQYRDHHLKEKPS